MQNEELTLSVLRNIETIQTQKSLADELGYSVGKINYVLKALIDKGLIKADSFIQNKNKNQYKYLLTQEGFEEKLTLTRKFVVRKKAEYEELQRELETSHSIKSNQNNGE
ncbi:MarR family EPS-associated transcriptional regulator [bacterium]|nr:MarR family EPS-associated transcriptional regulator [bacterium]MBU1993817.1 MarR family EPS-associated transcriptional regulator [bacterium]